MRDTTHWGTRETRERDWNCIVFNQSQTNQLNKPLSLFLWTCVNNARRRSCFRWHTFVFASCILIKARLAVLRHQTWTILCVSRASTTSIFQTHFHSCYNMGCLNSLSIFTKSKRNRTRNTKSNLTKSKQNRNEIENKIKHEIKPTTEFNPQCMGIWFCVF